MKSIVVLVGIVLVGSAHAADVCKVSVHRNYGYQEMRCTEETLSRAIQKGLTEGDGELKVIKLMTEGGYQLKTKVIDEAKDSEMIFIH